MRFSRHTSWQTQFRVRRRGLQAPICGAGSTRQVATRRCMIHIKKSISQSYNEHWGSIMNARYLAGLLCASLMLFSACDASKEPNQLQIGVMLPLTGTLTDGGTQILQGIQLALDEVNSSGRLEGTELALITRDSKSTTDGADDAFEWLVHSNNVTVVLGPLSSGSTGSILAEADRAGVVVIGPTSAASGLSERSKWLFRTSLTVDRLVPPGMAVAKDHVNFERIATLVNSGDTFSISSNAKVTEVLGTYSDVTIVAAEEYSRPPGQAIGDLTVQLTTIKNTNPDAIVVSGLPEDQYGVFTQGHALGITGSPYIAPLMAISDVHKVNEAVPGAAEGVIAFHIWLNGSNNALSRAFEAGYTARHGAAPTDWAARGYAAMHILFEALVDASSFESEDIQIALAALKNLNTIYGSFSFDDHGDAIYDPIVAQVRNNVFVIIE